MRHPLRAFGPWGRVGKQGAVTFPPISLPLRPTRMPYPTRLVIVFAGLVSPLLGGAQQTPPADTARSGNTPVPALPVELSGVLYPQFTYGGAKGSGTRSANRFELERAYLTARAKLSDRASIRATIDVFRPTPTSSYTLRAKYAYAQYDYWGKNEGVLGATGQVRLGMQQTVVIEHEEQFWPRWIARTGIERTGAFSSADLGASTTLGFGGGATELFAMVANGNGYTTPESDRFKDYSARLSIAPFGPPSSAAGGIVISPWYYKGARPGALRPAEARRLDRMGVFAGVRVPALTGGIHLARLTSSRDTALAGGRIAEVEGSSRLLSAHVQIRPFRLLDPAGNTAWGLLFRWDAIDGDQSYASPGGDFTARDGRFIVTGVVHELSKKLLWAIDFQQQSPRGDPLPAQDIRTYNLHVVANF